MWRPLSRLLSPQTSAVSLPLHAACLWLELHRSSDVEITVVQVQINLGVVRKSPSLSMKKGKKKKTVACVSSDAADSVWKEEHVTLMDVILKNCR